MVTLSPLSPSPYRRGRGRIIKEGRSPSLTPSFHSVTLSFPAGFASREAQSGLGQFPDCVPLKPAACRYTPRNDMVGVRLRAAAGSGPPLRSIQNRHSDTIIVSPIRLNAITAALRV